MSKNTHSRDLAVVKEAAKRGNPGATELLTMVETFATEWTETYSLTGSERGHAEAVRRFGNPAPDQNDTNGRTTR